MQERKTGQDRQEGRRKGRHIGMQDRRGVWENRQTGRHRGRQDR